MVPDEAAGSSPRGPVLTLSKALTDTSLPSSLTRGSKCWSADTNRVEEPKLSGLTHLLLVSIKLGRANKVSDNTVLHRVKRDSSVLSQTVKMLQVRKIALGPHLSHIYFSEWQNIHTYSVYYYVYLC